MTTTQFYFTGVEIYNSNFDLKAIIFGGCLLILLALFVIPFMIGLVLNFEDENKVEK